jgi:hypothetical protein
MQILTSSKSSNFAARVTAVCAPGGVPVPALCQISHKAKKLTANASTVRTASDEVTTNTSRSCLLAL